MRVKMRIKLEEIEKGEKQRGWEEREVEDE